jgi:hypothetical protein
MRNLLGACAILPLIACGNADPGGFDASADDAGTNGNDASSASDATSGSDASTSSDASTQCDVTNTFTSIYNVILKTNTCAIASCHGPFPSGGLQMNTGQMQAFTALTVDSTFDFDAKGMYPHRVVAGDPAHSFMYLKVSEDNPPGSTHQRMPSGLPPLSDCRISAIQSWIQDGARNN